PRNRFRTHPETLGGRFTTLEGILDQVYDELAERVFMSGGSSKAEDKVSLETFLENLRQVSESSIDATHDISFVALAEIKNPEHPFTIILDDPFTVPMSRICMRQTRVPT
ncbi:hypothetical protein P691DRAFT_689216, partial [Macrolepiota fuliginosa MF-IS2]